MKSTVSVVPGIVAMLFAFVSSQQWDYNDYSPTVQFTQAILPLYNQQPAMPTNLPYNYLYPGPPPVPPTNPPPQAYTLPYASYRKPPTGVDSQQRELLSKIAEESENFNFPRHHKTTSPASTKEQAFQQLLSNFVTQLPKIAQSMVQIGVNGAGTGPAKENWISLTSTTISPTDQFRPIGSIEEVEETDQASSIGPMEQNIRQDGNAGSLINSMPEPATFLSFNKLLSSFAEGDRAKGQNEHEETIYDMSNVRGTPILKSIDEQTEAIDKDLSGPTSTPQPSMLMNLIRPLLTGHKGGDTTVANMNTTTASKPPKPESDETNNLLASLIQGKLPKIDWLNAFLGPTAKNGGFGSGAKEEGNALAQIFGGKGGGGAGSLLFGSGLDDDPNVISRRNKS